jgi:hypothetical protein
MKQTTGNTTTQAAGIQTRSPLVPKDWDFSGVPEIEVVPCLIWEYLRESATAQKLGAEWSNHFFPTGSQSEQEPLWHRTHAIRLNLNHQMDINGFVEATIVQLWGYNKLANLPWQKLHLDVRKKLIERYVHVNEPVYVSTGDMHAGMLHQSLMEATKKADEKTPQGGVLELPQARAILPALTRGEGCEAFCVVIDWGRYDNGQIEKSGVEFIRQIIKTRPKGIKPQSKTGSGLQRKTEWRGMLVSLGLARLYGRFTASELKKKMPDAYKKIAAGLSDRGTTAVQKKLDGANRRFADRFKKILAFEKHRPLCMRRSS